MTDMNGRTCVDADHLLHKQWDELLCPICLDHPHNAVLLLCSSHDKGCRSYICDTSYRHSNCLDQYRKLRSSPEDNHPRNRSSSSFIDIYFQEGHEEQQFQESVLHNGRVRNDMLEALEGHGLESSSLDTPMVLPPVLEENSSHGQSVQYEAAGQQISGDPDQSGEGDTEHSCTLKCPLCRGKVTGWKVVKEVRQYLDLKLRTCSREACSFSGKYKELRKHARGVHPSTRPADVEPSRQSTWRRLERQREYGDILSTIRSAMPDTVVFGDYIIDNEGEMSNGSASVGFDESSAPWWTTLFLFHMFRNPLLSLDEPRTWRTRRRSPRPRALLWGENLLGLQDHDDNYVNASDLDFEIPVPSRRRRTRRSSQDTPQ